MERNGWKPVFVTVYKIGCLDKVLQLLEILRNMPNNFSLGLPRYSRYYYCSRLGQASVGLYTIVRV